ncbi:trypsin beta [Aphomia sociella]
MDAYAAIDRLNARASSVNQQDAPHGASASANTRIVGGTPTSISDYPFIASIEYYYPAADIHVQRCVGSLITSWHVLSSAYCFSGADQDNLKVRVGSTISLSGGTVVNIYNVIIHPDFVENPRIGDVAIVVLATPLGITPNINIAYIPPQQTYIPDGYPVQIISWGFESEDGPQIETLKKIESKVLAQSECEAAYEDVESVTIYDQVFCASSDGTSLCIGDSGAPLIIGETLMGLSSYYGACNDSTPDVFSRIDRHTGWILEHAVPPTGRAANVPVRIALQRMSRLPSADSAKLRARDPIGAKPPEGAGGCDRLDGGVDCEGLARLTTATQARPGDPQAAVLRAFSFRPFPYNILNGRNQREALNSP